MAGHLANEREAILDIVEEGVSKMLDQECAAFDRKLAELANTRSGRLPRDPRNRA
jgi:hypothetical protein